MARNQMFWVPGDHFFGARNFSDFLGFSTSPNIASCCAPGTSGIRDFHFLLGVGIRAPHSVIRRLGAGIQSLESGIAAFGSPTRPSISTYSRSTAPAAVMLMSDMILLGSASTTLVFSASAMMKGTHKPNCVAFVLINLETFMP